MSEPERLVLLAPPTDLVQIPDGIYDVTYMTHSVERCFGEGKLAIRFKILTMGEHFEQFITAWYRVRMLNAKECRFSCSPHSRLARDWRVLFRRTAHRWDRLPLTALKDIIIRARVRMVTKDHRQEPLDPINQYSVIDTIIGRLDSNV